MQHTRIQYHVLVLFALLGLLAAPWAVAEGQSKPKASPAAKSPAKSSAKATSKPKASKKAKDEEFVGKKPWSLRDHFSFTSEKGELIYGVDNTEWCLTAGGLGTVLDDARVRITLANGETIESTQFPTGEASRKAIQNEFGEAVAYYVDLPSFRGLSMRHTVVKQSARPFYTLTAEVKNTSSAPIEIKSISPAMVCGGIRLPGDGKGGMHLRRMTPRGPYLVYAPDGPVSLAIFSEPAKRFTFALGVLPNNLASSNIALEQKEGGWRGGVVCTYDPPVVLQPGQTLVSDRAWVMFAEPQSSSVDLYYTWARSKLTGAKPVENPPAAWVTVAAGQSLSDLSSAARKWSSMGVYAALIPADWESTPGSLEGASPRYPKNMASAVKSLGRSGDGESTGRAKKAKAKAKPKGQGGGWTWFGLVGQKEGAAAQSAPAASSEASPAETTPEVEDEVAPFVPGVAFQAGLTVDPLTVTGGDDAWAVTAANGVRYVNPLSPQGKAFAVERMRKVASWGFAFYAVAPSSIPAEVLKKFGVTRFQADALAFAIMNEAAPEALVYPASQATLGADLPSWLEASAATSRYRELDALTGPVRLDAAAVKAMDTPTAAALNFLGGPVEFVGAPTAELKRALSQAPGCEHAWASAIDVTSSPPRVWLVQPKSSEADAYGAAIVEFPGTPTWDPAHYDLMGARGARVWRAEANGALAEVKGALPASESLRVLGVSPILPRPVLLPVTPGTELQFSQVASASWDEAGSVFSGSVTGQSGSGKAFIIAPESWQLESGEVNASRISAKESPARVAMDVAPGKATTFSVKYNRK